MHGCKQECRRADRKQDLLDALWRGILPHDINTDSQQNDHAEDDHLPKRIELRKRQTVLLMSFKRITPKNVPKIEPRPPNSEVPPMTTAAMASNSHI